LSQVNSKNTCFFDNLLFFLGVFFALGTLAYWHARIISKGETSIEYYINKSETQRYAENGLVYRNPYDFGTKKNWAIFLGMTDGR
jgi:palmitoyltransferase